jgi:biopolymer transport protein ExbB/TolQ
MAQFPIEPKQTDDTLLAWSLQDIENRIGFKGGRYTNVNHLLAFLAALLLAAIFYGLMVFVFKHLPVTSFIANMFLRPSNLPIMIPATVFFFVGVMVLWLKHFKLRFQERALGLAVVPDATDFVLNETTAAAVLARLHDRVDHPRHFILCNRIDRALSNLKNMGQINDVSSILRAQAENDEDQVASSYTLVNGLVWAIPVLGFIGTVLGLSRAIGSFGLTLGAAMNISVIRDSLKGVTAGLATAFETTLVALVFALILQLWITVQQKREMAFLDECNDYCHSHVVSRLRLVRQQNPEAPPSQP